MAVAPVLAGAEVTGHFHPRGLSPEMNAVTPEHKCLCVEGIPKHIGKLGVGGGGAVAAPPLGGALDSSASLQPDYIQKALRNFSF